MENICWFDSVKFTLLWDFPPSPILTPHSWSVPRCPCMCTIFEVILPCDGNRWTRQNRMLHQWRQLQHWLSICIAHVWINQFSMHGIMQSVLCLLAGKKLDLIRGRARTCLWHKGIFKLGSGVLQTDSCQISQTLRIYFPYHCQLNKPQTTRKMERHTALAALLGCAGMNPEFLGQRADADLILEWGGTIVWILSSKHFWFSKVHEWRI